MPSTAWGLNQEKAKKRAAERFSDGTGRGHFADGKDEGRRELAEALKTWSDEDARHVKKSTVEAKPDRVARIARRGVISELRKWVAVERHPSVVEDRKIDRFAGFLLALEKLVDKLDELSLEARE